MGGQSGAKMAKKDVQEGPEIRPVSKGRPKWLRWPLEELFWRPKWLRWPLEELFWGHLGIVCWWFWVYFLMLLYRFLCIFSYTSFFGNIFSTSSRTCKWRHLPPQLASKGTTMDTFLRSFFVTSQQSAPADFWTTLSRKTQLVQLWRVSKSDFFPEVESDKQPKTHQPQIPDRLSDTTSSTSFLSQGSAAWAKPLNKTNPNPNSIQIQIQSQIEIQIPNPNPHQIRIQINIQIQSKSNSNSKSKSQT